MNAEIRDVASRWWHMKATYSVSAKKDTCFNDEDLSEWMGGWMDEQMDLYQQGQADVILNIKI